MIVVIPDDYQDAVRTLNCASLLAGYQVIIHNDSVKDTASLIARFQDADALVLIRERTHITQQLLRALPKLKLISQTGKIGQHLDLDACTTAGVAVAEGVGSPVAPAELTWALIMASRRDLCRSVEDARRGRWQTTIGRVLQGQTLGIWGYGKVGKLVARYANAFGMRVLVWGSEASRANARNDGVDVAESKPSLFENADVLTLHVRLSAATRHIVTLSDLRRMKPTALFVNTSRAELVEPAALEQALRDGRPGFAAVDVYEDEPVTDPKFSLFNMENVIGTPHLGYVERNSYELYFEVAFRNVRAFFDGRPTNIANPSAIGAKV